MRTGIHFARKRYGRRCTMTDPEEGGSRRGAIAGLLIAAVILAVGLWLAHDLTAASKMEDCLMSGRTNCNVIEPARGTDRASFPRGRRKGAAEAERGLVHTGQGGAILFSAREHESPHAPQTVG